MDKREAGDGEECDKEVKGAVGQTTDRSKYDRWTVNNDYLNELINLGINSNAAIKALFYTSNESVEKALDWIFNRPNAVALNNTTLEEDLGIVKINELLPKLDLNNDLNASNFTFNQSIDNHKMVFVINTSLGMSLGKCCAQTAHAALAIMADIVKNEFLAGYQKWLMDGETKIVLAAESTQQLEQLKEQAASLGLANQIIQDAGRTEIQPGSKTVLALFGSVEQVNKVTGHLKLLK